MMRHEDEVRLRHMFDHAVEARDLAQGRTREELDSDRLLNLALVRLLEIVGEAAARVPQETRDAHTKIPWQNITDMRNRLIHGYDEVDFDILWNVVTIDLPPLIEQLRAILEE